MRADRLAGLLLVAAAHAAILWGLWQQRMIPDAQSAMTLFVRFVGLPAPEPAAQTRPAPRPAARPVPRPQGPLLAAEAPVTAATDPVVPPPERRPPAPEAEPPSPAPVPAAPPAPVVLTAELSATCAERPPPAYPPTSRRLGETGAVVVRAELDEAGRVASARIATSSGHPRLDDAALAAVRTWHCTPARRNGQAVRAVALQPFKFVFQED